MGITIIDIAKQLNISKATVSRVLNKREDLFISEATRQRVLATAEELGYRPNRLARALATGCTKMVALWLPSICTPFCGKVLYYIQQELRKHGYSMVASEKNDSECPEWPVDGILVFNGRTWLRSFLEVNPRFDMPMVNVGAQYIEDTDYVGVDLYPAVRKAVEHLVSSGRKRIIYFTFEGTNIPGEGRRAAYMDVLGESGLRPEIVISQDILRATARKVICEYIEAAGRPDGIFCCNDDYAIAAYRALCDLGIRVPDDVALVGCDGIEDTEYLETRISTIIQPLEQVCRLGWEFLHRRMMDPSIPRQQVILQAEFVIRKSSDNEQP